MKLVMINETIFETENHMLSFLYSLKTVKGFENLDLNKLMQEKILEVENLAPDHKTTIIVKEDYDN